VAAWAGEGPTPHPPSPTVAADSTTRSLRLHGRRAAVTVWDTGGRDAALRLGRAFFTGAASFVLSYDAALPPTAALAALDWWADAVAARAHIAGAPARPPLVVRGLARHPSLPDGAAVAAAARGARARGGAPAYVATVGAAGAGPGAAAALDAAASAGAAFASIDRGPRTAFWGAGDSTADAKAVLTILSALKA